MLIARIFFKKTLPVQTVSQSNLNQKTAIIYNAFLVKKLIISHTLSRKKALFLSGPKALFLKSRQAHLIAPAVQKTLSKKRNHQ